MSSKIVHRSVIGGYIHTESLWCDTAFAARTGDPVIILEGMNGLQDRRDPTYVGINLRVAEEFGRQIGVETRLDGRRGVDPESRIEEHVIQ